MAVFLIIAWFWVVFGPIFLFISWKRREKINIPSLWFLRGSVLTYFFSAFAQYKTCSVPGMYDISGHGAHGDGTGSALMAVAALGSISLGLQLISVIFNEYYRE